jgi:hypothetical protein
MPTQLKYNPWYYFLNGQLIKKLKPCVPGNQVHIKKWMGCFTIHDVKVDGFYIMRNRELVKIPWDDFICLKGSGQSLEAKLKRELNSLMIKTNDIQKNITSMINIIKF